MNEAGDSGDDGSLPDQQQDLSTRLNLAVQLYNAGQGLQAETICQQILQDYPQHPVAYHLLGLVAHQAKKYTIAADHISKAIAILPENAEAHNSYGLVLSAIGRLEDAISSYRKAVEIKPDFVEAYSNMGITFKIQGRMEECLDSYRGAISYDPNSINAHYNLGNSLVEMGRLDEAVESYQTVLTITPDDAEALKNLGNVYKKLGRMDEALFSLRKAISIRPGDAQAHSSLGDALKETGFLEDAVEHFRKAVAIDPGNGEVHRHLANNKKFTQDDDDLKAMQIAYARPENTAEQKVHFEFALAKAFEDTKQFDKAFTAYSAGNEAKRKTFEFSIEDYKRHLAGLENLFNKDLFQKHQYGGALGGSPIFILGMPRSGSTLIEQILASHPNVHGAGELDYLNKVIASNFKSIEDPEFTQSLKQALSNDFSNTGEAYLEMLRRHSQDAEYITDKMPGNFMCIGMIKLMIPNAKIIHCRRDPVDTCLSIFKTLFDDDSHLYAYELTELGQCYNFYNGLMAHWHSVLPGFVHDIHYEDVVSNPENEIRKLLEYCQLDWDDNCLEFYKTDRQVKTASAAQVRRPIYSDSIAKWKQYETQLEPLLDVLLPGYDSL